MSSNYFNTFITAIKLSESEAFFDIRVNNLSRNTSRNSSINKWLLKTLEFRCNKYNISSKINKKKWK